LQPAFGEVLLYPEKFKHRLSVLYSYHIIGVYHNCHCFSFFACYSSRLLVKANLTDYTGDTAFHLPCDLTSLGDAPRLLRRSSRLVLLSLCHVHAPFLPIRVTGTDIDGLE
jgi:hypothetical protein